MRPILCVVLLMTVLSVGCATTGAARSKSDGASEVGPVRVEVGGSTRVRASAYRW